MRQLANRALHLAKPAVKPGLQLRQGDVRQMPFVKDSERQAELRSELFEAHFRPFSLRIEPLTEIHMSSLSLTRNDELLPNLRLHRYSHPGHAPETSYKRINSLIFCRLEY